MTREELASLYEATGIETRALLRQIADGTQICIGPESEELAILYAYDEIVGLLYRTLVQKEAAMRQLADA